MEHRETKTRHTIRLSELSEEEQVRAVERGVKPLATSMRTKFDTPLPCLEFEAPMTSSENNSDIITRKFNEKHYIYYQPTHEADAHKVKELIIRMCTAQCANVKVGDVYMPKPPGAEYHRELGQLLGYTTEEINKFINNQPSTLKH